MPVYIRVPLGIVVMIVGFLIVARTNKIIEWFGRVDWAEEKLGGGGTYTFYKLLGTLIVFIGIFISTNIISDILAGFAGIFVRK